MKWLFALAALMLGGAHAGWAADPVPIRTLREMCALTNAQASHALPVEFEATLTYFRSYEKTMFVQDGGSAIYIQATTDANLEPGDRLLIRGETHESFRPFVESRDITVLRHGPLPRPVPAVFSELIRAAHDCALVTVRAQVRAADVVLSSDRPSISLQMFTPGGDIDAVVDSDDAAPLSGLLDADVQLTGTVSGKFDGKMQQTGVLLHLMSLEGVKVLAHTAAAPWTLPLTAMDRALAGYHVQNLTPRVRVRGTITYYQPGSAVVLQDGARSLWITTKTRDPIHIGDIADATGFPDSHSGFLALTLGEIRDSGMQAAASPKSATWRQLSMSQNIFDLVSIEGMVLTEVREASQDEYVLDSGGQLLTAIYRHPAAPSLQATPPMMRIPLGSRLRLTGVCVPGSSNPFDYDKAFNILLRSYDDIAVIDSPGWLTVRNLAILAGILFLGVVAAGFRSWTLERKVRLQTAAASARIEAEAALERRRSLILEDINGSRALGEIIQAIEGLVSSKLAGAPCWCEMSCGASPGNALSDTSALRLTQAKIPSRMGPPLGTIYAGLAADMPPSPAEAEALTMGAGLAELAIETRRLYADLLHRSEFDMLTDIHNRFSLDKHLDALIADASRRGGIFGLIYIDLDDFKQVNDLYGHHTGDLYLQEVSWRMKRQMRAGDVLARLGGDEFAALAPIVGNRADLAEMAERLARSFDEPFDVDGVVLHGSASVGAALYPDDGLTRDSLLSSADAAMYVVKNSRHSPAEYPALRWEEGLTAREPH